MFHGTRRIVSAALLLYYSVSVSGVSAGACGSGEHAGRLTFHLVRECQRSEQTTVALEYKHTLKACAQLARHMHGLALNYAAPGRHRLGNGNANNDNASSSMELKRLRNQQTVYQQPAEFFNCHVLQCPENASFASVVNDSRFDYYSIYGRPLVDNTYSCLPAVGLFRLSATPTTYFNASLSCSNSSEFHGALAHIASANRTNGLTHLFLDSNKTADKAHFAFVGLHFNRTLAGPKDFRTGSDEWLQCFLFRAWDVGSPRTNGNLVNESCVALTTEATWRTVSCARALPFICEIFTAPANSFQMEIGINAAHHCISDNANEYSDQMMSFISA